MDASRYRLAGGGLMFVAAGIVVASLWVERVGVLEAMVPTLALAVGVYLLGVVAIAPVHVRAGEHERLLANVLIGVGVLLLAWSTIDGPAVATVGGVLAFLAGGALLILEGREDEDDEDVDATADDATDSTGEAMDSTSTNSSSTDPSATDPSATDPTSTNPSSTDP